MKTTLFNPLKIYREGVDVINFLFENIPTTQKTITVPFATHCYYTLPLREKIKINYNIIDPDCYNFWLFASKESEMMCEVKKRFFKPPSGEESAYYSMIEKQYHVNKNLHFHPILTLILSRPNLNLNLFGGPYNMDFNSCFTDWFYDKLRNFDSIPMDFQFKKQLDYTSGFYIQHIPKRNTAACLETFDGDIPYHIFEQMSNFILICDDKEEAERIPHTTKIKFSDTILLGKIS